MFACALSRCVSSSVEAKSVSCCYPLIRVADPAVSQRRLRSVVAPPATLPQPGSFGQPRLCRDYSCKSNALSQAASLRVRWQIRFAQLLSNASCPPGNLRVNGCDRVCHPDSVLISAAWKPFHHKLATNLSLTYMTDQPGPCSVISLPILLACLQSTSHLRTTSSIISWATESSNDERKLSFAKVASHPRRLVSRGVSRGLLQMCETVKPADSRSYQHRMSTLT